MGLNAMALFVATFSLERVPGNQRGTSGALFPMAVLLHGVATAKDRWNQHRTKTELREQSSVGAHGITAKVPPEWAISGLVGGENANWGAADLPQNPGFRNQNRTNSTLTCRRVVRFPHSCDLGHYGHRAAVRAASRGRMKRETRLSIYAAKNRIEPLADNVL